MNEFLILLQGKLDEAKSKGLINSDIASLQGQLDKLKLQVEIDPKSAQKLANDIGKLLNQQITISNINIDTNQAVRNAQQTGQQIGDAVNKGVENSVKKATNALKSFSELKIGTGNIDAIVDKNGLLDVEKSLDRIKEKYSKFGQVKITDKLFDSEGNLQQFRVNIQQLNGDLKESRSFMMALASSGKSFGFPENVIKGSESYVHHLNDATVKALDTALVDLKKTTTMTNSELEDFYYDSNKVAKQMGVTTEEIINQASAWSRLGFSSEAMATKMAKYSSMFASISPGLDLDSATDGLVSTMKAFSIGLDNADDVVDGIMSKINIIGNSKALNNSDIVDFLTRSSSALASANNSIEESIAMGEAIVEITRDAAGAGQVMKTTSMRIRGYDEELESYTEDLENLKGEIADLTKTAKTPGGISLFTDETKETYKSTYKILEEISTIWNDLTDKNQANIMCLCV